MTGWWAQNERWCVRRKDCFATDLVHLRVYLFTLVSELGLSCFGSSQLAAFSIDCYGGFVCEVDVDGAAGVDGGVVDEGVPGVVAVFESGLKPALIICIKS